MNHEGIKNMREGVGNSDFDSLNKAHVSWSDMTPEMTDRNDETKTISHSDLRELAPNQQLEYVSSVVDRGINDEWNYIVGGTREELRRIANDKQMSPMMRAVAEGGEKLINNSVNEWGQDEDYDSFKQEKHDFGYSTIINPDRFYHFSDNLAGSLNEEQLESRLKAINEEIEKLPETIEANTEDEQRLRDLNNQKYEIENSLYDLYFNKNQFKIHHEFPALPKEKQLVKIASDAAATVEFEKQYDDDTSASVYKSSLGIISDKDGRTTFLNDDQAKNDLEISDEMRPVILAAHNPYTKEIINQKLAINIEDISLESQLQLLNYMTEAGGDRFDRLCTTLHSIDPKLRLKLAENFLAAEFGPDFGDSLLEISNSEKLSNQEKAKIFDDFSSCRESIKGITSLYGNFDNHEFTDDYLKAANERLTDAVTAFREIAKNGTVKADLDWAGRPQFDIDSALEALNLETKSLEIINGTMTDVKNGKEGAFAEVVLPSDPSDQRKRRTFYNFFSPEYGYVLLYTRPEGSHSFDKMTEYGKERSRYDQNSSNVGAEASISFIVNPVDPFPCQAHLDPTRG